MARPLKNGDEPLVTRSLKFPPSLWRRVERAVPAGERSEFVREAVEEKLERAFGHGNGAERPVWQLVRALFGELPEGEKERLPGDLSENLDHYVYGTERQQP